MGLPAFELMIIQPILSQLRKDRKTMPMHNKKDILHVMQIEVHKMQR